MPTIRSSRFGPTPDPVEAPPAVADEELAAAGVQRAVAEVATEADHVAAVAARHPDDLVLAADTDAVRRHLVESGVL